MTEPRRTRLGFPIRLLRVQTLAAFAAFGLFAVAEIELLGETASSGSLAGTSSKQTSAGFVVRSGNRFLLNGEDFRVAGVNNHYLAFGSQKEVEAVLDDAEAMNANVVRAFVTPVIGSLDGQVPTIWNWRSDADSSNLGVNGAYMAYWEPVTRSMGINDGPNGLQRLDFVLAAAAKRHLRVIVTFADYWAYTGGARQMSAWYTPKVDDEFFAKDARTRADYKRLVQAIVTRINSLSGAPYKDDPTIFAWELMNEPDIHPTSLFRDWVWEMAAYVKSIDAHHLVASGHSSINTRLLELESPDIDFGTWHGYPTYLHISARQFEQLILDYCSIANGYGKPVLLEEFGEPSSDPNRAEDYGRWLKAITDDHDCGGWLVWRLVSRQSSGQFPYDRDQFDIHRDGGDVWTVLKEAASAIRSSDLTAHTEVQP
jgi:mannan endo-1,4-beta-mannosidase